MGALRPRMRERNGYSFMSDKALLVVSFGTTYPQAQRAIVQIEEYLASRFPDYDFYRAFTSGMVINKLKRTQGIEVWNPEQAMEELKNRGYRQVLCQTLHVIPGQEYDKMRSMLRKFQGDFDSIRVGKPMLFSKEDYEKSASALLEEMPSLQPGEALVLMGHGTEHFANSAYSQLENMFYFLGHPHVLVGTVEGFPGLDYVRKRLKEQDIRKVYLAPFMIVAGDHAQNDLGGNEEDSWKSILEQDGYETQVLLQGLGELPQISRLFGEHLDCAEELD